MSSFEDEDEGSPEILSEITLPFNTKTEALFAIEQRYQRLKKRDRAVGFEYLSEEDLRKVFLKYIPKEEMAKLSDDEVRDLFHEWYNSFRKN